MVKKVSELNNTHIGKDIYIIGTGTSMRVFPASFLENKVTIGLNRAWEILPVTYCISMVPHLNFPEFTNNKYINDITWVTKHDKYKTHASVQQLDYAENMYYFFRTNGKMSINALDETSEAGRMLSWVSEPTEDYLYLWSSISQSAVNLAANMGAKNIILIGCDNSALSSNHHAHDQHTLWKGVDPNIRYLEYYEGLAEMRPILSKRGINLLSMNPFLKLDSPDLDFARLCREQDRPELIENEDIYKPTSLRDNNLRYLRLTKAMIRQNKKYFIGLVKNKKTKAGRQNN